MKNSNYDNQFVETLPGELDLVQRAKSGDANAFVQLYDLCIERVYLDMYFLIPNSSVAEGLTLLVFFKAWEQLDRYQSSSLSFIAWLYSLARHQVMTYYSIHNGVVEPEDDFVLAVRRGDYSEEIQGIRNELQSLSIDQKQVLILKFIVGMKNKSMARIIAKPLSEVNVLQMQGLKTLAEQFGRTELKINANNFHGILEECLIKLTDGVSTLDECLADYPKLTAQLRPLLETAFLLKHGRNLKPLPTFVAYTHDALTQYAHTHSYSRKVQSQQKTVGSILRPALVFAVTAATFLVTGTAHAQSALPGEPFYDWKRTSEQVWRAISPDPVTTDIAIAERRLNEWVAVANNPMLDASAMNNYQEALSRLTFKDGVESPVLIMAALESQKRSLKEAGLSSPELDDYLTEVSALVPGNVPQPVGITATQTVVPTAIVSMDIPNNNCPPKCGANKAHDPKGGKTNNGVGNKNKDNSNNSEGNNNVSKPDKGGGNNNAGKPDKGGGNNGGGNGGGGGNENNGGGNDKK